MSDPTLTHQWGVTHPTRTAANAMVRYIWWIVCGILPRNKPGIEKMHGIEKLAFDTWASNFDLQWIVPLYSSQEVVNILNGVEYALASAAYFRVQIPHIVDWTLQELSALRRQYEEAYLTHYSSLQGNGVYGAGNGHNSTNWSSHAGSSMLSRHDNHQSASSFVPEQNDAAVASSQSMHNNPSMSSEREYQHIAASYGVAASSSDLGLRHSDTVQYPDFSSRAEAAVSTASAQVQDTHTSHQPNRAFDPQTPEIMITPASPQRVQQGHSNVEHSSEQARHIIFPQFPRTLPTTIDFTSFDIQAIEHILDSRSDQPAPSTTAADHTSS
ncbi:hypothetical protein BT63DRAFT_483643 [Microthyrium microscopicum]|uniref:Uncharacterized protein n=1 Tax=Microthyrium microscopicum TaxID=703497 RepID=A0A6A6TVW3_9PEZI|nr:hypothetical protein BT63DRAFT_483643 [Microthyrium microscopicum]